MADPRDPETIARLHFLDVIDTFGSAGLEEVLVRAQVQQALGRTVIAGSGEVQLRGTETGIDFTVGNRGPFSVTFAEAEHLLGLDEPR